MREKTFKFTASQQRLLQEVTRRHADEMNTVLAMLYEEMGLKEEIMSQNPDVQFELLPNFAGIRRTSKEVQEDAPKKEK